MYWLRYFILFGLCISGIFPALAWRECKTLASLVDCPRFVLDSTSAYKDFWWADTSCKVRKVLPLESCPECFKWLFMWSGTKNDDRAGTSLNLKDMLNQPHWAWVLQSICSVNVDLYAKCDLYAKGLRLNSVSSKF